MSAWLSIALLAAAQAAAVAAPDPCAGQENCRQASAAELFAVAETLASKGDLAGAEQILQALTQDPSSELRAEARFRLAQTREKLGNLDGAAEALRALLAEQPGANRARLELGRILAAQGKAAEARRELGRAQEAGLPADVARTVGRLSSLLTATRRRGGSVELLAGFDSNANRSTSDQFIDTIIAPFELDANARGQSAAAVAGAAQAYSRDGIGGLDLLTRGGIRGDLFPGKSRFNDVQFYAGSGPEFSVSSGRIRPAVTFEQRWFGGEAYSRGVGALITWSAPVVARGQLELEASIVKQWVRNNETLDGTRYTASAIYDRALSAETTARFSLRGALLDAAVDPESLFQGSVETIVAHDLGWGNLFANAGFAKTRGRAPIALFGKTRDDDRVDFGAGLLLRRTFARFAPLVRLTHTRSRSNIALYEFSRTRLDFGVTREF